MLYLILVSILWGFSFGLIKGHLTGIDTNFVSFARIFLSFLVFAPFIRLRGINFRLGLKFALTGMLQFGVMYITYIYSFHFLKSYEVALFTVFTPLYVALIDNTLQRRNNMLNIVTAFLALIGTAIVSLKGVPQGGLLQGFLLVQTSNLCFAFGQVYYKNLMAKTPHLKDQNVFGLLYLGGAAITALSTTIFNGWNGLVLSSSQVLTLLYLGVIASGICFFLWNLGGRLVNTGTLGIFNNLKVPVAVAISLLFFGEQANIPNLIAGGAIVLAALFINEYHSRRLILKPA
ncbi:MAG: EamA family transporter [Chloroflexota bacterium]